MNRSQAFKMMLPFIAVSFAHASAGLPAPQTDTVRHEALSSAANASPLGQDSVDSNGDSRYKMQVSVDEVRLTFHAVDKSGRPVNDLMPVDLDLFDNEAGPGTIVALQMLKQRPLRIGFLVDASGSASGDIGRNRAIAIAAAKALATMIFADSRMVFKYPDPVVRWGRYLKPCLVGAGRRRLSTNSHQRICPHFNPRSL